MPDISYAEYKKQNGKKSSGYKKAKAKLEYETGKLDKESG